VPVEKKKKKKKKKKIEFEQNSVLSSKFCIYLSFAEWLFCALFSSTKTFDIRLSRYVILISDKDLDPDRGKTCSHQTVYEKTTF